MSAFGNRTSEKPRVIHSSDQMRNFVREQQANGNRVGVVPTMGALHAGHLSLVQASTDQCDCTVVTIFINPTQFGPGEDFQKYPRTLESDLGALSQYGVSAVFVPEVEVMYPPGHTTSIDVGQVSRVWEGARRPTHFQGVATVVMKLFQIIPANCAFFGQKDYQQALVIRRMVEDLNVPVQIVVCPIVREPDGLAMSSRNVYLSTQQRRQALSLSRALRRGRELFVAGESDAIKIVSAMRQAIDEASGHIMLDYLILADPLTLEESAEANQETIALVAAQIGATRLIDNHVLSHPWPEPLV